MLLKNTREQFGLVAKSFHWVVGIIVLLLLSIGFWMTGLEFSPFKLNIYMLHKSFGILVLILVIGRLIWRKVSPRPDPLPTHAKWEDTLAKAVHFGLYTCLFIMPLDGWIMSSAGGFPATFFGLFPLPALVDKNPALFEITRTIHTFTAYAILALLALHFAGAFKHHFIDRDATLQRMTSSKVGLKAGLVLAAIAGILWIKPVMLKFVEQNKMPTIAEAGQASNGASVNESTTLSGGWTINVAESTIGFSAKQYGESFQGKFKDFGGKIIFDPSNLDDAYADIWIDIASIDTGSSDRDGQARSPEWFDTQNFPKALFVADPFSETSPGHYIAHGALTIRGKAAVLDLPFTLEIREAPQGQIAHMVSTAELKRLDFGVGQGQWQSVDTIGDAVKITIDLTATE